LVKRKKRLIKQIKGLEKQAEKHKLKKEAEKGKLDTTPKYWEKEIEIYERQVKEKQEMLKKMAKKALDEEDSIPIEKALEDAKKNYK